MTPPPVWSPGDYGPAALVWAVISPEPFPRRLLAASEAYAGFNRAVAALPRA